MENLATILEQELEEAVQVKNKSSLHRYILLLTGGLVSEDRFKDNVGGLRSDVKTLAESMYRGFDAMDKRFDTVDKRFEAVDRRFEDVNRRFEDVNKRFEVVDKRFVDVNNRLDENGKRTTTMMTYMNVMLGALVLITVLFKFI